MRMGTRNPRIAKQLRIVTGSIPLKTLAVGRIHCGLNRKTAPGLAYSGRVVIESGLDGDLTVTEEPDRWVSVSENEDGTIEKVKLDSMCTRLVR